MLTLVRYKSPYPQPKLGINNDDDVFYFFIIGPCLRAGCAHAPWADGGRRSDTLGTGKQCLAPLVGGGLWSSPDRGGALLGGGGVRSRGSMAVRAMRCLPTVRSRVCVDAWAGAASGFSFRAVDQVTVWVLGLLLRGERVDYGNDPDNVYSQGGQELNPSVGAC